MENERVMVCVRCSKRPFDCVCQLAQAQLWFRMMMFPDEYGPEMERYVANHASRKPSSEHEHAYARYDVARDEIVCLCGARKPCAA